MPTSEDRALRIRALNRSVVEEFRASNGKVTHPRLKDAQLVLLTTIGARTGQPRTTPLAYFSDGPGRIVLWASAMAAASHPAWYHNLTAVQFRRNSTCTDCAADNALSKRERCKNAVMGWCSG
jgi:deazaflavin-dependent oxidoreductase (nitroreductase family)